MQRDDRGTQTGRQAGRDTDGPHETDADDDEALRAEDLVRRDRRCDDSAPRSGTRRVSGEPDPRRRADPVRRRRRPGRLHQAPDALRVGRGSPRQRRRGEHVSDYLSASNPRPGRQQLLAGARAPARRLPPERRDGASLQLRGAARGRDGQRRHPGPHRPQPEQPGPERADSGRRVHGLDRLPHRRRSRRLPQPGGVPELPLDQRPRQRPDLRRPARDVPLRDGAGVPAGLGRQARARSPGERHRIPGRHGGVHVGRPQRQRLGRYLGFGRRRQQPPQHLQPQLRRVHVPGPQPVAAERRRHSLQHDRDRGVRAGRCLRAGAVLCRRLPSRRADHERREGSPHQRADRRLHGRSGRAARSIQACGRGRGKSTLRPM